MRAINYSDLSILATHEVGLVVLSVVIAVIASYTALELAGRVTLTKGGARHLWLIGGASAILATRTSAETARKASQRAEEEFRFLQTITQAISESTDFHSALEVALRKVCDFTGWKFGEAWIPNADGTTLEYSPAWYGRNQNLEKFRQLSAGFTFAPGTGLPGRVWLSKHPEWIQDVSSQPDTVFVRSQYVKEAGFKAGLGIPILYNNQVLAVLVFFMFEDCEEDKRLVEIVSTVATQLGSLIQHKQAEEALRESEERFRLLVDSVKDYAIFILDIDGNIASWNTGAERINGYRAEEILGRHFSCFYPEEDIALGKPEIELQVAQEVGQIEENGWRVRKDGSRIWVNVVITALRDSCGKIRGFSKVTRDITSRKRAEETLRENEERYRAVVEQTSEGIFLVDANTKCILEANAAFQNLLGYTPEEILRLTFYDIVALDRETIDRIAQLVLREQHYFIGEAQHRCKDGSLTDAEVNVNLISYGGRDVFCVVAHDITQRKQAENALSSSVATNRALLNAIPDSMFRISKEGTFVNFKAAKDNNLPFPTSEFLGKNVYEVLPTEVAQQTIDCLERALSTGDIQIFEYQLLVNNNLLDYEVRIAVSAEDEVMAIIRDITARKRAEEDIRKTLDKQKELSELKTRFVSMTSHEFRTPLTTILSSAELLEKYSKKLAEEKKLQHLHRIQASVKHMTQLLNNVLLIGKAEAGKLEYRPVPLDLAQFCRDLVEELQMGSDNNHTIAFASLGECTNACVDEKLLRYILSNLLSNAIKYSPQSGTVNFDLICQQGEAIFLVQDHGIGIPPTDQAQLFNSFHRASNVGTISGTGLGLAIVKKSVDLHKGMIAVKSEVGVGTTFTVTLPLNKQVETNEKNSGN